jgi:hypothetical protein
MRLDLFVELALHRLGPQVDLEYEPLFARGNLIADLVKHLFDLLGLVFYLPC